MWCYIVMYRDIYRIMISYHLDNSYNLVIINAVVIAKCVNQTR